MLLRNIGKHENRLHGVTTQQTQQITGASVRLYAADQDIIPKYENSSAVGPRPYTRAVSSHRATLNGQLSPLLID
jgi:hypothetical protein